MSEEVEKKEWLEIVKNTHKALVFVDDVALSQAPADNTKVTISAPFFEGVVATHLPFMGEKGADYLLEKVQGYYRSL